MELVIFGSLIVGILIVYILGKSIIEYRVIVKVKKRENELARFGVYPSGSSVSHGMYVNKRTGEVMHNESKSDSWYKRML